MKLVIIGAGIVGLAIGHSALGRGHRVTIIEQGPIPNPHSASFDEHRMIRYQYRNAEGYSRMVVDAFAAWERLFAEMGRRHFSDSGVISISLESNDYAAASLATLKQAGLPQEVVEGATLEVLVPQLELPNNAIGVLCHPGGPLYADRIVTDLISLIEAKGGELLANSRAVAIDDAEAQVTLEDGRVIAGDAVIVAAGAWLDQLLPDEGTQSSSQRQTLAYVTAPQACMKAWQDGPALCVIGDRNVYTLPPRDGTGLKFGSGALRRTLPVTNGFAVDPEQVRAVIGAFAPYLRDPDGYVVERGKVGYYVADSSREFRLHRRNRRLVITNCDGQMFKFGALFGEKLVDLIEGQAQLDAMSQWIAGRIQT